MYFYWFEIPVDDAHAMYGPDCQNEIGEVCLGVLLFEIALILQQLSEASSAAVVENEEVKIV